MAIDPFSPIASGSNAAQRETVSRRKPEWTPLSPVPADAPAPPDAHWKHGAPCGEWKYLNAFGELIAIARRFDTVDGEKEFYPLTYCELGRNGPREWRWKAPAAPRPLYGADRLQARRDAPVILCEGEKAADAAAVLLPDHVAVTTWGGSNAAAKASWSTLARRRVTIWPDADEAGRKYAENAARCLKLVGASVSIVPVPTGVKGGWDAADALNDGWDIERVADLVDTAVLPDEFGSAGDLPGSGGADQMEGKDEAEAQGEGNGRGGRITQSDRIVSLVDDIELWRDHGGEGYATYPVRDHWENGSIRKKPFKVWLTGRYCREYGAAPGGQALEDGLRALEARAIYEGPVYETYRRISAMVDGALYIDLCDDSRRVIRVSAEGWGEVTSVPVKFIRSPNAMALPDPEVDDGELGGIDRLRDFINVAGDSDFRLLVAWLVGCLAPRGPYPLLLINGEQGSAKSTATRLLRDLIDPNRSMLRSLPREERDLAVAAQHSHCLAFDNVSGLPSWLSDALCRMSTGGGVATRALHTDSDEFVMDAMRPCITNGIPDLAGRPDLGERSIVIQLNRIAPRDRRSEREIEALWSENRAFIFGAMLDGLSSAIRKVDTVTVKELPRLADFARWVTAAEAGLGFPVGAIVKDLEANRQEVIRAEIDNSDFGRAVERMANEECGSDGLELRPDEVLEKLNERVSETIRKARGWPTNGQRVGTELKRLAPSLRKVGIEVESGKTGRDSHRVWRFRRLE